LQERRACAKTEVIDAWSKIVGDFYRRELCSGGIARRRPLRSRPPTSVALRARQISKPEILRKLKQRFGGKTIRDIRLRVG